MEALHYTNTTVLQEIQSLILRGRVQDRACDTCSHRQVLSHQQLGLGLRICQILGMVAGLERLMHMIQFPHCFGFK